MNVTFGEMAEALADLRKENLFSHYSDSRVSSPETSKYGEVHLKFIMPNLWGNSKS